MNLREWARATHRAYINQPAEMRPKDFSMAQVEMILRQSIDVLVDRLASGESLRTDSLGQLSVEDKPSRQVISHLAGQSRKYRVRRRRVLRLRPSAKLTARLNRP
jgi:nucleoid DNA-binding protein